MDIIIAFLLGWFIGGWAAYIYCWCLYSDEADDADGFNIREFVLTPITIIALMIKETYLYFKSLKNKRR